MSNEKIAVLENRIEDLKERVGRLQSHIESEDGTVLRVNKSLGLDINKIKEELSALRTDVAIEKDRLQNIIWWIRGIILMVVSMLIKILADWSSQ